MLTSVLFKSCCFLLFAIALFDFANTQRSQTPPCGPNSSIPQGYSSCRDANGNIIVGPPPVYRPGTTVATPPVYRPGTTVATPPPSGSTVATPSSPPTNRPVWLTVAGITAIAALITAFAGLIRAFR